MLTKKDEGPLGKEIAQKSRKSHRARGEEVGAEGMVTKGANWRNPGTNYKRSKNAFAVISIALTLVPFGIKLSELPVQSLIGSPGTLEQVWFLTRLFSCAYQKIARASGQL